MTDLLIHWVQESKNSIMTRTDFCCERAAKAYGEGVHGPLIAIPHFAIGLANGMHISYCPFCGAKVVSINTETGERVEWASLGEGMIDGISPKRGFG